MLDDAELGKRFDRHRQMENTAPAFELVHATVKITASVLNQVLPPGRKAALALTALEEALMHANGAIACDADAEWLLPEVDVSEQLDDLAEHLEGPLHLRSKLVGGGGPVEGPTGGDIGPETGRIGAAGPDPGEIVPDEGISVTSLDDDAVQQLIERQGSFGPADDIARRSRTVLGVVDERPDDAEPEVQLMSVEIAGSAREWAEMGPVEPVEGAERVLHGDCLAYVPTDARRRCELVAGHDGDHKRGTWVWS